MTLKAKLGEQPMSGILTEIETDVLVVGSGGAGLTTALVAAKHGLKVLLIEKTDRFGGTTALSGGGVWAPGNPVARDAGLQDSISDAAIYARHMVGAALREDLLNAFLQTAPELIAYLHRDTPVKLQLIPMPEYDPDAPGALGHGRVLGPVEFDGRELGPLLGKLRPPLAEFNAPFGMMVSLADVPDLLATGQSFGPTMRVAGMFARYAWQRLLHGRGTRLTMGSALVGRLLKGVLDAGVELRCSCALVGLDVEGGRVVGALMESSEGRVRVRARRGVMLATGGFSADPALRNLHFPYADQHVSIAPPGNTGDGIRLAQSVGAAMESPNNSNASWIVCSLYERPGRPTVKFPHFFLDKPKPGCIAVNARGERFGNEASRLFTEAMHSSGSVPAWLICDRPFLKKYGLGLVMPGGVGLKRYRRDGYLIEAPTLALLAEAIGIPPAEFEETVKRFNEHALQGRDPDFDRGVSTFDRSTGDPTHRPNASLGPILAPPFYAVKIFPGDTSTTIGLKVDARARVTAQDGNPIPGLYASGLDMNSLWRGSPPANGCYNTLSLTFGYIAARDMAATA